MRNILFIACIILCAGCHQKKETLKIAASQMPHAQILEGCKEELLTHGITLEIIPMDEYTLLNRALAENEVDANFFQHRPFMEAEIEAFGYPIQALVSVHVEPMGLYSTKITQLSELPHRAVISIPNDPTNEARALALLHTHGIIKLKNTYNRHATILDIIDNPKELEFIEIDAQMLSRTLPDVVAAVIPSNFALQADLHPVTDALILEDGASTFTNIVAIRTADIERADLQVLKTVLTSDKIKEFIQIQYKGALKPVF